MERYELTPTNGRKSFGGKAIVEIDNTGNETLVKLCYSIIRKGQETISKRLEEGKNMNEYAQQAMDFLDIQQAYKEGGYRERYAMEHGNKQIVYMNGNKCFKFTYSKCQEYQDANGAIYDTVTKTWRA